MILNRKGFRFTLAVLGGALAIQALSIASIGTAFEPVGRIVSIYPGSLVLYLLPTTLLDRIPEGILLFLGMISALAATVVGLISLTLLARRLTNRSSGRASRAVARSAR